jgi:hypothetical protein
MGVENWFFCGRRKGDAMSIGKLECLLLRWTKGGVADVDAFAKRCYHAVVLRNWSICRRWDGLSHSPSRRWADVDLSQGGGHLY